MLRCSVSTTQRIRIRPHRWSCGDEVWWLLATARGVRQLFFFSSRRRQTRCYRDWSSDVCSSDLACQIPDGATGCRVSGAPRVPSSLHGRSEERRVGKECRSRWSPYHEKKK